MKLEIYSKKISYRGFTLLELLITVLILGILTSMAIPGFTSWLPDYKLKNAAQQLYSNMHLVKIMAIKENKSYRLVFLSGDNNFYNIERSDGIIEKTIHLNDYETSRNIVVFGCGNATKAATISGGPAPDDGVSYSYNKATFNSKGLGKSGYVYLSNSKGSAYAIGTWSAGIIVLKKWNSSTNSWDN